MNATNNAGGYRLGLVSVSFRKHSPEQILAAMKEAGLSYIEWGSDVHAPCRDRARLLELAELQARYGVSCCSYGTYFRLGQTPLEELADYAAAAKTLGTQILRVWCGTQSGASMTKEQRDALIATCHQAAEIARAHDVVLCTECHRGTFTEHAEDTVELMQAVGSEHFRTYWQPFQWLDAQGSLAVAKAIAPWVEHVHVFNWKGELKLSLDEAIEQWRAYLGVLPPPRALLLEFMPDDRIESLMAQANALRMIGG